MSITIALRKAARIQEQIEGLRAQLSSLLAQARAELTSEPASEVPALLRKAGRGAGKSRKIKSKTNGAAKTARGGSRKAVPVSKKGRASKAGRQSPLVGRKRSASPSGPLAPAVVKVLEDCGKPMSVKDILEELTSDGYTFASPEPKKNLAARIYRLNGVKQVAPGLFAAT